MSGVEFWPFNPKPEMVRIGDIAHALAAMPRYGGHAHKPYNVADHSVRVARLLREYGAPKHIQKQGLLHDAAEAYLMDIPAPLKEHFGGYNEAESRLLRVIFDAVGAHWPLHPLVKRADAYMLAPEWRDLMPDVPWTTGVGAMPTHKEYPKITPLPFMKARAQFLECYHELS